MPNIMELIETKCPYGVKYQYLKELCKFNRGSSITSKTAQNGKVPVISGGQRPAFYHNIANRPKNTITIAGSGAYAGFVSFWEEPIFCADAFSVDIIDENILNKRYLYHFLLNNQNKIYSKKIGAGIPHVYGKDIENLHIPVPPLKVQDEIVHILDDFTLLSAELSAELKARQKQYEYYKGQLLSNDCKEYKLGEVAEFKTGTKPENILEDGNIEYINAGTTNSGYTEGSNISGDKVTTPSRGQGGIGYVGYQKNDFWLGPLCYAIWSKDEKILNNKYLYYELSSKKDEILKRKNTGGVPALNGCDLKTIPIKVPSLEEQMKIVNVLDNFEKICEDLVEGLPAEIEARRKQYEYYRDKLLTFKELVNEG